ncbi:MAG: NUDIX hydrolase N-terminal domain-containing protein [Actinocatenispora sp.]
MTAASTVGDRITALADEIRGMAATGLHYCADPYDRTRYERLVAVAAELLSLADARPAEEIERLFRGGLGLLTPAVAANAAIFDAAGRLLLTRRADNGSWCLPGGSADVGESPSDIAVRETREETGLEVRATGLIGVYDSRRLPGPALAWQAYVLVFACEVTGGELATTHEVTEFRWCAEDEATALELSVGSRQRVPDAFAWRREPGRAVFH